MSTCQAPVLFLIFNRPKQTARVFGAIRAARPTRLYVAADGPRLNREGEADLCRQTRELIVVDWPCEINTLYREENLGCRRAVTEAINWFFENEEEGIILEDDCLPNASFFYFCKTLLERYRDDPRVMSINGSCYSRPLFLRDPYAFTTYADSWGWATWRRAWRKYDADLQTWTADIGTLEVTFPNQPHVVRSWKRWFDLVMENPDYTWDFQWGWTIFREGGLVVTPYRNMIRNIGFGEHSTHTIARYHHLNWHRFDDIPKLKINVNVVRNYDLERDLNIARLGISSVLEEPHLGLRIVRFLRIDISTYFLLMTIFKVLRAAKNALFLWRPYRS